ncbi:MAG: protein tyrosine phosphatase [Rhizobiaceae bacterium]
MSDKVYHVLFLSRRNSARSILAEAVLNKIGKGRFAAYSAAVEPAAAVDPHVVELLASNELRVADMTPRHYREFAQSGAADIDFVFTLSDTAAGEPLPEWPGQPVTAHWSSPDPILATGAEWERKQAFTRVVSELERRLSIFINLPFACLDRLSLKHRLDEIGGDQQG